jgi:hypothetical protein
MNVQTTINSLIRKKIATVVLITASLAAFATLGDESSKESVKKDHQKSLLKTNNRTFSNKSFSLKTQFNYRGNNILNGSSNKNFIMMNTVVTYQKGNATYILPLKKKIILDKISFNTTH